MSDPPDFRLEQSELRSEDEFGEFGYEDLEYFVDFRGTFDKLPLCPDDESLAASGADVAIVGAPTDDGTSGRPGARFGPRAIRSAPTTWGRDAWSIQLEVEPYERLRVVDAGDAPVVPSRHARALRVIHEKVHRVAGSGALPFVLGGDHSITYPSAAAVARHVVAPEARRGPLRRARGRGELDPRVVDLPRHADAAVDRGGMGRGPELRPARPARVLAGEGHVRLDAGAGVPLAHDRRDRGARHRRGDRRRHRGGAGRSGPRVPLGRHRRRRPGDGSGDGDARAGRDDRSRAAAGDPPGRRRRRARRAWTWSRCRRRTTRAR